MVANLRCNELKDEALEKTAQPIQSLRESCSKRYQTNFREICENIMNEALTHYNEYAKSYDKTVYDKIKGELVD